MEHLYFLCFLGCIIPAVIIFCIVFGGNFDGDDIWPLIMSFALIGAIIYTGWNVSQHINRTKIVAEAVPCAG